MWPRGLLQGGWLCNLVSLEIFFSIALLIIKRQLISLFLDTLFMWFRYRFNTTRCPLLDALAHVMMLSAALG